jgi:hypothetical protein
MFVWEGLKQDVDSFVKQCGVCQQAKHERSKPAGLLQPLPIPAGAWQDWTMDFIESLPESDGQDTILVVVDRFTKYAHLNTESIIALAIIAMDSLNLFSDRDKIFTSAFCKELFKLWGTALLMSVAIIWTWEC